MASKLKAALLGLALSAGLAVTAQASAPTNHETKALRAPAASLEQPLAARYARARSSMNDGWDSWDDERPRATRKAKRHQAQKQRRAHQHQRQARRHVERETYGYWDDEAPRPSRRANRRGGERSSAYVSGGGDSGIASYYWQGQRTASGAAFNPNGLTAAHRTLPFGTRVRVTHLGNGRTVDVTINDRGPFIAGRIIDLSRGAASVIGMTGQGLARVKMEVIGR